MAKSEKFHERREKVTLAIQGGNMDTWLRLRRGLGKAGEDGGRARKAQNEGRGVTWTDGPRGKCLLQAELTT